MIKECISSIRSEKADG